MFEFSSAMKLLPLIKQSVSDACVWVLHPVFHSTYPYIHFYFIYIVSCNIREKTPQTEVPISKHLETVERKNSPLTGKDLWWNQAQRGAVTCCNLVGGGEKRKNQSIEDKTQTVGAKCSVHHGKSSASWPESV